MTRITIAWFTSTRGVYLTSDCTPGQTIFIRTKEGGLIRLMKRMKVQESDCLFSLQWVSLFLLRSFWTLPSRMWDILRSRVSLLSLSLWVWSSFKEHSKEDRCWPVLDGTRLRGDSNLLSKEWSQTYNIFFWLKKSFSLYSYCMHAPHVLRHFSF